MPEMNKLIRIASLKTVVEFREHLASLGLDLPCEDEIARGSASSLGWPVHSPQINGKRIGNRYAVHPMEGWDATTTGGVTDEVRRRWRRFGESGAKLICGGEAMAVHADGRANPRQLIIHSENKRDLAELRALTVEAHRQQFGPTDDLVIGFQLTHSGRYCKPHDSARLEPRVAYRHPLLDPRFGVTREAQVITDGELEPLIDSYAEAARIAWDVGADFVDIKHCHGYLLHEFLGAYSRPGQFGGSFENRTRLLREIVQAIRSGGNHIEVAVRLSAFDLVPFVPDPSVSRPGKPGPGVPEDYSGCIPYRYAFGVNPNHPVEGDLTEAFQFAELCLELGVKILNLTAGSPYYNPHIQRPAAYPPSDGYLPPEDPLVGVTRQVQAVRQIRAHLHRRWAVAHAPPETGPGGETGPPCPIVVVGSAYSYLQEFLPHVAQAVIRRGWVDVVGIGRMILSYPTLFIDALRDGTLNPKAICRTFSDCTTAPRNGLVSGCYPLDKFYASKSEALALKAIKKGGPAPPL